MEAYIHNSSNWFPPASWFVSPFSRRRKISMTITEEERKVTKNINSQAVRKREREREREREKERERNGTFSSRSLFRINLLFIISTVGVGVSVYDAVGYHFSDLITLNNEPMSFEKVGLCNFIYSILMFRFSLSLPLSLLLFVLPFFLSLFILFLFLNRFSFISFYRSIKSDPADETCRYEKSLMQSRLEVFPHWRFFPAVFSEYPRDLPFLRPIS